MQKSVYVSGFFDDDAGLQIDKCVNKALEKNKGFTCVGVTMLHNSEFGVDLLLLLESDSDKNYNDGDDSDTDGNE